MNNTIFFRSTSCQPVYKNDSAACQLIVFFSRLASSCRDYLELGQLLASCYGQPAAAEITWKCVSCLPAAIFSTSRLSPEFLNKIIIEPWGISIIQLVLLSFFLKFFLQINLHCLLYSFGSPNAKYKFTKLTVDCKQVAPISCRKKQANYNLISLFAESYFSTLLTKHFSEDIIL